METYTRTVVDIERAFDVSTLRELALALPLEFVSLEDLRPSLNADCWNAGYSPGFVADRQSGPHWQPEADLTDPLLLDPEGWVGDGNHRMARHAAEGTKKIPVKRFTSWRQMAMAEILEGDYSEDSIGCGYSVDCTSCGFTGFNWRPNRVEAMRDFEASGWQHSIKTAYDLYGWTCKVCSEEDLSTDLTPINESPDEIGQLSNGCVRSHA